MLYKETAGGRDRFPPPLYMQTGADGVCGAEPS